jgi:hypothetical protein
VPGIRSSRTYVLDTKPDPRQPQVLRTIEPDELARDRSRGGSVPEVIDPTFRFAYRYVVKLAEQGVHAALQSDPGFLEGLNVAAGELTHAPVAAGQRLASSTRSRHCRRCTFSHRPLH